MIDADTLNIDYTENSVNIKRAFLASVIIGFILIITSQFISIKGYSIIPPVIVMTIYLIIGLRNNAARPIIEQYADSIYYMGFLFTLVALAASLIAYEGENVDISKLITNFAIALVTTVYGLTARIYLNNFRTNIQSLQRRQEEELGLEVRHLIENAKVINMRMESFMNEMTGSMAEGQKKSQDMLFSAYEELKTIVQISNESITTIAGDIREATLEAIKQLKDEISNIEIPENLLINRLDEPIAKFSNSIEGSAELVNELKKSQQQIRDNSRRVADSLEKVGRRMGKIDESLITFVGRLEMDENAIGELNNNIEVMNRVANHTVGISERFSDQLDSAQHVSGALSDIAVTLDKMPVKLSNATSKVVSSVEEIYGITSIITGKKETLDRLDIDLDKIGQIIESSQEKIGSLSTLSESLATVTLQVEVYREGISRQGVTLEEERKLTQERIGMLRDDQNEINNILERSREALNEVTLHYINAANYVTNKLVK